MKARYNYLLAPIIAIGSAGVAHAASFTWNGLTTGALGGVSDSWDTTTANWGGTWPTTGTDNDAIFGGTAGTVTISTAVSVNDLTFNTANYKIDGGTLTLNGTAQNATNTVTAEIASILAGTANLTKKSAGTLILSGANTLSGNLIAGIAQNSDPSPSIVNDGILRLAHSKAAGTSTITVNGGYQRGRLELNGGIAISNAITLQGRQTFSYPAILNNGGDNQITGTINAVANGARLVFNSSAGNLTISGAAMTGSSGRTLTLRGAASGEFAKDITSAVVTNVEKLDAGTWTFSGTNTYSGTTSIQGRLIANSASALGTGNVTVNAGATLDYIAKTDSPLAIGGTLTVTSGASGGTNSAIGGSIGSDPTTASINVTGTATITNAAHAVNIHKVLGTDATTGTYTLISGGAGSVLNPATTPTLGKVFNNSDFTVGALSRTATTLDVAINSTAPLTTAYWVGGLAGSSNVWAISDGSTASNWAATDGGLVQPLVPGPSTDVVVSSSAVTTAPTALVLGANTAVNKLTIADTTNGFGLTADPFTLTIGSGGVTMQTTVPASSIGARVALDADQTWTNDSSNTLTVAGAISGSGALIKSGSGTLILSGSNTFSGNTDVDAGVIGLANVNALAGSVLNCDAADTGTLTYLVTGTSADRNTYNIGGLSGDGALDAGGKTLSIGAKNQATEFSGVLSNGTLTKVGTSTFTLSGDNTFTGNVTVTAGRLTLAHSNALGLADPNPPSNGRKGLISQGGSRSIGLTGDITIPADIDIFASSNSFDGGGIENISGDNEITGPIYFSTGNAALNISSASDSLTISGDIAMTQTIRTLYLGGASAADNTISGDISETLPNGNPNPAIMPVIKQGLGKWIFSGINTYKGDTTVNGGTLVLADGGSQRFLPLSNATSNKITGNGSGAITLDGALDFVLTGTGSAADAPNGTDWLIIDVANLDETYGDNFTVTGFTETALDSGVWEKIDGARKYTFTESTGLLEADAAGSPFQTWAAANITSIDAGADATATGDPDGDGSDNLAEFALAGDPLDSSDNGLTRFGIEDISGTDHLTLTFACRSADAFTGAGPASVSKDGVTYTVRGSTDLGTFTVPVDEVTAIPGDLPTAPVGYTYRTFRVTDAVSANPKAFIQLQTIATP